MLFEVIELIKTGHVATEDALRLITTNPANNLGLKHKGRLKEGYDADICIFDKDFNLQDVFARGQHMMHETNILVKGNFES